MRPGIGLTFVVLVMAGCLQPSSGVQEPTEADPAPETSAGGEPTTTPSSSPSAEPGPTSKVQPNATARPTSTAKPPPIEDSPELPCAPTLSTGGHGDPAIPSLTWAALKTGGRVVIAWQSQAARKATLEYSVNGGAFKTASDDGGRGQHVFILDAMPLGKMLCFRVSEAGGPSSELHGLRLYNAMNAWDPDRGSYQLNLLVIAKYEPNRGVLEGGLPIFARTIHDATDGYVEVGEVVVLYANPDANYVIVYGVSLSPSNIVQDVIFQYDHPAAAGYTFRDAIKDRNGYIIMNQVTQAGPTPFWDSTEVGKVLAHEMGHYAFGALDLYTETNDCVDPRKNLSVMGSDRDPDEFDDEVNRCPNASSIAGYVPTWKLLRDRYKMIPDRLGVIDEGPEDAGSLYHKLALDMT